VIELKNPRNGKWRTSPLKDDINHSFKDARHTLNHWYGPRPKNARIVEYAPRFIDIEAALGEE
jgi:hypothetical protein